LRSNKVRLAIVFALIAALLYAVLGMSIKLVEEHTTNEMAVFFRQIISIITLSPFLFLQKGGTKSLKTSRFPLHFMRAFASLASMYCLFYAIKHLPLVDALLLSYTRPLFIPLVVLIWFKKKWTKHTWFGLITGFLGVALILKPDKMMFNIAALIGLGSGLFGAVAFTAIRRLTRTERANTILFYYFALSIPVAALPLARGWKTPDLKTWGLLVLIGVLGVFYQQMLTRAYQYAKAHKVASILYTTIIFAALFDWWLGDFSLDYISVIGIVLIIVGTLITLRQRQKPYPPEKGG
jgi:drug/metabolite transporter (DMT)-like permease